MSDFNLYSVNWQDGMLLTQQHLQAQERFIEELTRWYSAPLGDRYGLVRFGSDGESALQVSATVSGDRVRVEVRRCQAITPDGHIIYIAGDSQRLHGTVPLPSGEVPVFVGVEPAQKIETGEPDASEEVPRLPDRTSAYSLHIGESPQVSRGRAVQIAVLTGASGEVVHSPHYLPPCVTTYAHESLHAKVTELRNRLESYLSIGNRAYAALAGGSLSGGGTELRTGVMETIYQFVSYLSSTLDDFVVGRNAGHPMSVVLFHKKLFRVFYTLLNLQPGVRDYVHERYFVQEAGSDVSRFMSQIDDFVLAEYNHEAIGQHVAAIESISEQIKGLLAHLANVKEEQLGPQAVATDSLTYSGRTFHIAPYSGTRVERMGDLTYLEVDLADPKSVADTVILLSKRVVGSADWSNMHVRLGLNEARGLGETDPVMIDTTSYGDKVALHPHDMLQSQAVRKLTLIFRGVGDGEAFSRLGKMDLFIYTV